MTELKLLRIEPILLRSTPSAAAAGAATGGVTCLRGRSDGSLAAGTGPDTCGWAGLSVWSSTEQRTKTRRQKKVRKTSTVRTAIVFHH